jgi:hypothetical protein
MGQLDATCPSRTLVTLHDSSSDRRAPTGVRRNLSSGPSLGRPCWSNRRRERRERRESFRSVAVGRCAHMGWDGDGVGVTFFEWITFWTPCADRAGAIAWNVSHGTRHVGFRATGARSLEHDASRRYPLEDTVAASSWLTSPAPLPATTLAVVPISFAKKLVPKNNREMESECGGLCCSGNPVFGWYAPGAR